MQRLARPKPSIATARIVAVSPASAFAMRSMKPQTAA
jgi:hypothetical protein